MLDGLKESERPLRHLPSILLLVVAGGGLFAQEGEVVFRSDVSLVRVDAQVLDRDGRAITGLRAEDFILREEGKSQAIRNFAQEDMPVDVLFLLDVSGSMQPHIERLASAAHEALGVLGPNDRVGIMVFDRRTRLRMPFQAQKESVEREMEMLLRQETFDGGTDINRGLLDAANYVRREGRRDARRAIVILTDDQTERGRDEANVTRALANADAVLSALLAPDAMRYGSRQGRMGGGNGPWNGGPMRGGGSMGGGPLGGIILGRRGPYGNRMPGPVMTGPRTQSAGTAEIARNSGGDSMNVDDAAALETTLSRIRQRYALHFYLPDGVKPGEERNIEVELANSAARRYPNADVRFRRVYVSPGGSADPGPSSSEPTVISSSPAPAPDTSDDPVPGLRRRRPRAVSEPDGPRAQLPATTTNGTLSPEPESSTANHSQGGWRRTTDGSTPEPPADESQPRQGGWRRLKPGEEP